MRRLPRQTRDADQARRILAVTSIHDGGSRANAARLGSATVQILRDWLVRFNDRGADGLINGKAPGKPSPLIDDQRTAMAQAIERGRRRIWMALLAGVSVIWHNGFGEEFSISVSEETLRRGVQALDYRKLSARPRHHALGCRASRGRGILRNLPAAVAEIAAGPAKRKMIEIWFQLL